MLEHFHVAKEDQILIMPDALKLTVTDIFLKMNMSKADADQAADVLVMSDVRGVDTHGVSNMLRNYVKRFGDGFINPRPKWKIVRETPATANIDSDRGLGIVVGPKAMEIAIEKAKKVGVGCVTIGNGRHMGMIAYYPMQALKHDMIGYAITGGGANTVPTFGAIPRLGANPHAWAVPADKEPPFVLDMSSSAVAANKIGLLRRMGKPVLPGLVADETGTPVMQQRQPPLETWMLPLGATRELGSHKGYGLGVIAQVFSGILATGAFGDYYGGQMSHFVAAYSIEAFTDTKKFKKDMDAFLRYLRETPPAPGQDRVYYAGLPEHEEEQVRRRDGIPLHREVVEWFDSITAELSLTPLARKK
ncbi:MAG: Ldh family oxidoreductase [Dehalococcoidia bacterium]|nr:Ldh family oxidoreductase [Dehalococcoidia bacterium]MSQ35279.1 Ldh family oxidoreductase [Dehalococcoidia bacterium]